MLDAACGGLAVILSVLGIVRGTIGWPLLGGAASGCTLLLSNIVVRLRPAEDPKRPLFSALFVANGIALAALGISLGWLALRPRFVRRAISRLASDPERTAGGLAAALATALGDPGLHVGYPLPGGPIVDGAGREAVLAGAPTQIFRGGELVAVVGSTTGELPTARLERALGPAVKLALANERLRAEELIRLHELTALRRRLVETGDAERRRIERDLHDGAQQRLLALAIDLQVALKHAHAAGSHGAATLLRATATHIADATTELRRVAHGIFPSTLANAGLVAALESLADERPLVLSIRLESGRRFPAEIEAAAYALVADASAGAADPVRLTMDEAQSTLVIALEGATTDGRSAEDRIGAAGGTLRWTERRLEAFLPLPPPD
jgi:signal transduction histidine kinase